MLLFTGSPGVTRAAGRLCTDPRGWRRTLLLGTRSRQVSDRVRLLGAVVALAAIGVPGSAVAAEPAPRAWTAAKVVAVGDNYFRARTVSIHVGRTVTWRWRGRRRHNVRFTSGRRRPKACSTRRRGSCTRTFSRRGIYRYVCTLHGSMAGRVTVVR